MANAKHMRVAVAVTGLEPVVVVVMVMATWIGR